MFIGVSIPSTARSVLQEALHQYEDHIERFIPEDNWHLTMAWLGSDPQPHDFLSKLLKPIAQSFTITVNLTHIGRGKKPDMLWAYAAPTIALHKLHEATVERLQAINFPIPTKTSIFVPHISLGYLADAFKKKSLADYASSVTFPVRALTVYEKKASSASRRYNSIGQIELK